MNRFILPLFVFLLFFKNLTAQVDTVPPVIVCKNINELTPGFTCSGVFWAVDFVDTVYDDQTSLQNIQYGIRKICTGSGFPENKEFVPAEILEYMHLEIWARDASGNTSFCTLQTMVGDVDNVCDPSTDVLVLTPTHQGIKDVMVVAKGGNCLGDSLDNDYQPIITGQDGSWSNFGHHLSKAGFTTHITPSKNINPLNGVSTYDLVLITKHILSIEPFDSPWKIIAADANQDGKVTTSDLVTLRKLILGVTTELPNGKSWRFAPQSYSFPDPSNPFNPPFPERIEIPNTTDPAPSWFQFKGVKIGDVDFSADPGQ